MLLACALDSRMPHPVLVREPKYEMTMLACDNERDGMFDDAYLYRGLTPQGCEPEVGDVFDAVKKRTCVTLDEKVTVPKDARMYVVDLRRLDSAQRSDVELIRAYVRALLDKQNMTGSSKVMIEEMRKQGVRKWY